MSDPIRKSNCELRQVITMHKDDQQAHAATRTKAENCPSGPPTPRIERTINHSRSRSFEYGIAILECFWSEHQALGVFELADIIGTSRSTAHRYALTLVALGYLEQDDKRRYRLSVGAAGPGRTVIDTIRRQVPARFALEGLRDETGYTVSMAVLEGARVVYIYRLFGHRRGQSAIDMGLGVGATIPVFCTALGKVLLASVSKTERRKIISGLQLIPYGPNSIVVKSKLAARLNHINLEEATISDEEFAAGSRSIAALVRRSTSRYPVAVDVTVPSSLYTMDRLVEDIGIPLKRTARHISGE